MDIATLFLLILLIGVFYLMSRSARNRQRQAMEMRDAMQPGTGVRTVAGMYALVKEVRDDIVLLEIAPGVHALYTKNAISAVLEADEYERIVSGAPDPEDSPVVPDDVSSLTGDETGDETWEDEDDTDDDRVGLEKTGPADATPGEADGGDETEPRASGADGENGSR